MSEENPKPAGTATWTPLAVLGVVYVVGFLATATYYVVANFKGCEVYTARGRCFDFDVFIEALVYSLIWPLHWLLEIIEALDT